MAVTNFAQIRGDESGLRVKLASTGATDLEFISGSFLGSVDEERLVVMFVETTDGAPKRFEIKVSLRDPRFAAKSIVGAAISSAKRAIEDVL